MNNTISINTINPHCTTVTERVPDGCGIRVTVFSYDTPVLRIDEHNNIARLWDGWSATTQRDINRAISNLGMNKSRWQSMPVVC